jgi:membrane dipeptidase
MHSNRREMMAGLAALAALPGVAKAQAPAFDYSKAIIIDGLGGPDDPAADKTGEVMLSKDARAGLLASGITAFNVTVGDVGNEPTNWDATISNIGHFGLIIAANPGLFVNALSAADIRAAKAAGRIALVYGTQDTALVGTDLDRLATLKGLGVRIVQLTYNRRNLSGDGSLEPANGGLSKLGRATIERIEAEKLLLDLSHGGQRTIAEAIAAAKRPMTISHTGARALTDNPRNVWDAEMKACADKGGVVGIYFMPFLVPNSKPQPADVVRHLVHAVNVCGEDHVGIGTDGGNTVRIVDAAMRKQMAEINKERQARGIAAPGEGPDVVTWVSGLDGPPRFRVLAGMLEKQGWTASRIEKVLGGNVLRLYGDAWGG